MAIKFKLLSVTNTIILIIISGFGTLLQMILAEGLNQESTANLRLLFGSFSFFNVGLNIELSLLILPVASLIIYTLPVEDKKKKYLAVSAVLALSAIICLCNVILQTMMLQIAVSRQEDQSLNTVLLTFQVFFIIEMILIIIAGIIARISAAVAESEEEPKYGRFWTKSD
ncbi:MAG: hypothetical protein ACTSRA_10195 [Promethearchaeota archaeon]